MVDERSDLLGPTFTSAETFLAVALPVYVALALAVILLLRLVSGVFGRSDAAGLRGAIKPLAGYLIGLMAALVLGLLFGDLVLGYFMSDVPPAVMSTTVWLLLTGGIALCIGLLAGLVAGAFEVILAPLSVWVGAALALEARFTVDTGADLFDPGVFLFVVPFVVCALVGGIAAFVIRWRRTVARSSVPGV